MRRRGVVKERRNMKMKTKKEDDEEEIVSYIHDKQVHVSFPNSVKTTVRKLNPQKREEWRPQQ